MGTIIVRLEIRMDTNNKTIINVLLKVATWIFLLIGWACWVSATASNNGTSLIDISYWVILTIWIPLYLLKVLEKFMEVNTVEIIDATGTCIYAMLVFVNACQIADQSWKQTPSTIKAANCFMFFAGFAAIVNGILLVLMIKGIVKL